MNHRTALSCICALLGLVLAAPAVRADDTIKRVGDHPRPALEIEPHGIVGWGGVYANGGYGVGARLSLPIVENGFIPKINNSVAISFGLDILRYDGCWYYGSCAATFVESPVTMQWNFYVAQKWSVFGEPGLVLYHGFLSDCPTGHWCGDAPTATGVVPAFYAGGRYAFSETMSLTMRVGYPTISVGLSFL
jgi:hypothetical protein